MAKDQKPSEVDLGTPETRKKLIQALRPLKSKREWMPPKKHGNIPL